MSESLIFIILGSTILSPLLKSKYSIELNRLIFILFQFLEKLLKKIVHCELLYKSCDKEKVIYLIVYQSRKNRKILHKFILDDSELYELFFLKSYYYYLACSFVYQNKREFQFKHALGIENVRFLRKEKTNVMNYILFSLQRKRVLQIHGFHLLMNLESYKILIVRQFDSIYIHDSLPICSAS
jgi:hypothetical protein